jgi:penicillin-binding protein 1C
MQKQIDHFFHFLKKRLLLIILFTACSILTVKFIFLLPDQLFQVTYSTVVEDAEGELLSAIIAEDGQWRFPVSDEVPWKFLCCITEFEDSRFFFHNGIDPSALLRAAYTNLKHGSIISGGSTITMQVIRLSRKGRARTFREKLIEMAMAIRLEFSYSKAEILSLYAAHAPFGSNVVGLEAASWRYFGIEPDLLSWGQAATLAVLPNAPSLIYPGKNETALLDKRNFLLKKLYTKGYFTHETYEMAISEPLPGKPYPLPDQGIHIINRIITDGNRGQRIRTTIRKDFQEYVQEVVNKHAAFLAGNKVNNAAAIVIDVKTGNVIAYVGNTTNPEAENYQVDIVNSLRSPGSTLKPLLYCAMLRDGTILPNSLVPDIPMMLEGFNPQNYYRTYDGAVPASGALSRSLNVPAVHMLKTYGYERFNTFLKQAGLTSLSKPPSHYGLSLILGGAEVTLYELAGVYASMARILLRYNSTQTYDVSDVFDPVYYEKRQRQDAIVFTDAASIWYTFKAMVEVNRPDEDQFWYHFSSQSPIAWKTGTSYGERDAWAIGVTPGYVVGIWAGNASGEGRPGLTGIQAAAPLMFEIFDFLPKTAWFEEPLSEMISIKVCTKSGYKASDNCEETMMMMVPKKGIRTSICPYHKKIHLDPGFQWQVHTDCQPAHQIVTVNRFVLPPVMEYYYKARNPFYKTLPPYRDDCSGIEGESRFGIIYPVNGAKIYMVGDMPGIPGEVVFRAAHRTSGAVLYWHLDGEYIGSTKESHNISVKPDPGKHQLTVVDQFGEIKICKFEILN